MLKRQSPCFLLGSTNGVSLDYNQRMPLNKAFTSDFRIFLQSVPGMKIFLLNSACILIDLADSHRQHIINWIDDTGQLSAAFDFTTKGVLQEAVKGQLWRLRDPQGKPPGVMERWPSRALTFLDNHDTDSTQAHWPFPANHIMEGYAYILTHPGIPTVFYDHFYDWGNTNHDQIVKLIDIRTSQDIHSRSSVRILEAQPNVYSAVIGEKVCMKIGDGSWSPSGREWMLATSGHGYAVWQK